MKEECHPFAVRRKKDGGVKQRNGKGAGGPKKVVQTNRTKVNILTGKCLEKG